MKKLIIISSIFIFLLSCIIFSSNEPYAIPILSRTNALEVLYALTGTKSHTVTPLTGGISGSVLYKVDCDDKSYVIRFLGRCNTMKERYGEINAQIIASQRGYGPQVYASDIGEGWIIMDYLQPTALAEEYKTNSEFHVSLGKCLKQMHSGNTFLPSKSIIDRVKARLHLMKEHNKIPLSIDYKTLNAILELASKKYRSAPQAPTHRDLNVYNILFVDHKPFLIDFEDAAQDDPFYDLATVGIFYIIDLDQEALFLNAYFGHMPTKEEYEHYQIMKQVVFIKDALVFLNRLSQEAIMNASISAEYFKNTLEALWDGTLGQFDPAALAISELLEAIDLYNASKEK